MKKLLLTLMMLASFGMANLAYADYHYDNVDGIYHTIASHETKCFAEYKDVNDIPKPVYAFFYFDAGKTAAVQVNYLIDNKNQSSPWEHSWSVWFKDYPMRTEGSFGRGNPKGYTKYESCITNYSPIANMYLKVTLYPDASK